jgi:DNA-binding NarL/FixJ family response regulator
VLVVDDDVNFAELLAVFLGGDPRLTVVGRAGNGADGVELAVRLRPDVVVMDVEMPVLDGLAASRCIRRRLRGTRVVLVSGSADPELPEQARAAGADAFTRKSDAPAEILESVARPRRVAFAIAPALSPA